MGSDLDGTSGFIIGYSSRLLLFDTAEVEMTTSILSLLQGLLGEDSCCESRATDSMGTEGTSYFQLKSELR